MDTALRPSSGVSASVKWAIYAGIYTFACGTAIAYLLDDMLSVLADVIGLPSGYATVVFASPALVIGTLVWWAIVERRGSYSYLLGGAFGLLTALLTGLLWTARFVDVWGIEMLVVPMVSVLVAVVLAAVVGAGLLTGLPLMYARRRNRSPSVVVE